MSKDLPQILYRLASHSKSFILISKCFIQLHQGPLEFEFVLEFALRRFNALGAFHVLRNGYLLTLVVLKLVAQIFSVIPSDSGR